jgi:hypothetical protein
VLGDGHGVGLAGLDQPLPDAVAGAAIVVGEHGVRGVADGPWRNPYSSWSARSERTWRVIHSVEQLVEHLDHRPDRAPPGGSAPPARTTRR